MCFYDRLSKIRELHVGKSKNILVHKHLIIIKELIMLINWLKLENKDTLCVFVILINSIMIIIL